MIRLLAMLATAALVVWVARSVDLERWRGPASEAGAHLEQAARALAPAAQAELSEALKGRELSEALKGRELSEAREPEVERVDAEPRVEVRAPAEFAPEPPQVESLDRITLEGVESAALGTAPRAEPLSSEEVEQIRYRLDRVMIDECHLVRRHIDEDVASVDVGVIAARVVQAGDFSANRSGGFNPNRRVGLRH